MASWYNFSMKKQSKTELNKMKKSFQTGKILKLYFIITIPSVHIVTDTYQFCISTAGDTDECDEGKEFHERTGENSTYGPVTESGIKFILYL